MPRLIPFLFVLSFALITQAATELRLLTHSSFHLPASIITQFERQHNTKLIILKGGDAGVMLNKLILTRSSPIADVFYGLDNSQIEQANKANILAPLPATLKRYETAALPNAVSVDYGYVTLNYDIAWFQKHALALPRSLDDLTLPAYKNLVAIPNPNMSSPGRAFLFATIAKRGADSAFQWWEQMKKNGIKITNGWTETYYTAFTRYGGDRPIVLSYASSPAAEIFFSKPRLQRAPTANLLLPGSVFYQVEGAGIVKGGKQTALATAFLAFLRSTTVQNAIPTSMWVYPMDKTIALDPVFQAAPIPKENNTPNSALMAKHSAAWLQRWSKIMLRSF